MSSLSVSASLVFEQSYGGVEGDSASSAELYALLSALAQTPIKQSLAVTGSVNQKGQVQAIGGVNEKIEGFFDICQARGLSEKQGVIIPENNVRDLMLRADVRDAAGRGEFHIYAVSHVDQVLALLTGIIQIVMGLTRLGFLVNFLSHPVISGFTSAAAIGRASSISGPARIFATTTSNVPSISSAF